MDCKEYVELRKKELDGFLRTWEDGIRREPGIYPKEMDDGEWYEQELAHNELNGREEA